MDRRNFLQGVAVAVVAPTSVIPTPVVAAPAAGIGKLGGILITGVHLKGTHVTDAVRLRVAEHLRNLAYAEFLKKGGQVMEGEYTFPAYVPQKVEPFVGPPRYKPLHTWID